MDREPSVATRYRLNALLASLPDDAKIVLGRQPFQGPAHLEALRDELRDTHFVRRARDGIEAIGYRVVVYRTTSAVLSALFATLAGAMLAIWLRYNGPDTSLSFEIMMDVLLIVVIGGMGTIYGAAIGAVLPGLPTVPFLLVAAWAGGKGWPALEVKLLNHPRYGPTLRRRVC